MKNVMMLACLMLTILVGIITAGCGGPSPSKVAEKFMKAVAAGDFETIKECADPAQLQLIGLALALMDEETRQKFANYKIERQKISGDSATVSMKSKDGEDNIEVKLIKSDKKWLVSKVDEVDTDTAD